MTSIVTTPRAGMAIAGDLPASKEMYRWMHDVSIRIGGIVAPTITDLSGLINNAGAGFTLSAVDSDDEQMMIPGQPGPQGPQGAPGVMVVLPQDIDEEAPLPYLNSDVAYTNRANLFTKAQTVTPVVLTDAANVATDASLSNHFTLTLGGNRTLDNPTNLQNGVVLNWKIKQDGTGSRTLAYGSKFKWPSGTAPVLTTTASATDYLSGHYFSDVDILVCSMLKGIA